MTKGQPISAYILKTAEKDPFLRLQMKAKEELRGFSGKCCQTLSFITVQ